LWGRAIPGSGESTRLTLRCLHRYYNNEKNVALGTRGVQTNTGFKKHILLISNK